jgi:hypothetical protein
MPNYRQLTEVNLIATAACSSCAPRFGMPRSSSNDYACYKQVTFNLEGPPNATLNLSLVYVTNISRNETTTATLDANGVGTITRLIGAAQSGLDTGFDEVIVTITNSNADPSANEATDEISFGNCPI